MTYKRTKASEDRDIHYYQIIVKYNPRLEKVLCDAKTIKVWMAHYKSELISDVAVTRKAQNFLRTLGYTFEYIEKQRFPNKKELFGVPVIINGLIRGRKRPPETMMIVIHGDKNIEDPLDYDTSLNENTKTIKNELQKLNFNFDVKRISKEVVCTFLER